MDVLGGLGGLEGFQNRCQERWESAGEAVNPPSGPKEGARGAQGTRSGGVRAVMHAKSEPGGCQQGAKDRQERRERAPRGQTIGAR